MNFTLNQLRVYHKISQTLSITKAAQELHLTQPAVTIQLKNLQDQLKLPLLNIVNKKIYITDFGYEVALLSEKILEQVYSIESIMNQYLGFLTGSLRISSVSTGKYIAPFILSDFIKLNSGVDLILDVTNKAKVIESLEKNEVDFSLVSVIPDNLRLEKVELMENKLFLIGANNHSTMNKEINKKKLAELPMIYREKGSGTRHVMERYLIENDIKIIKKMELTSNEAVKQAVLAGLGYSIMPLIGIKNELESKQLKIIPVKGFPIQSTWNLIWLKDKKLSPVAAAYLNYIQSEKQKIIHEKFTWHEKYR